LWIDRGAEKQASRNEVYEDREALLSKESTARLQEFVRQRHLTMNTILQAAWGLLLSKYSGEEEVVFGTTVSGRPVDLPGSEAMIGPFINTLPVRMRIPYRSLLISWLSTIQSEQIEDGQYAYSSLVEQHADVPLGTPLYESILIFENYPMTQLSRKQERRIDISDV
jgi:surfactin family lipopeptide synthetase C